MHPSKSVGLVVVDLGCPPTSPDITPRVFVVWGYVKDQVCSSQISNKDELKTKISEDFGNISNAMRQNLWSEFEHSLDFLQAEDGGQVDCKR